MKHSSVATTTMLTPPSTSPNDSRSVVAVVRFSAGLTPGKNFSAPKPRNTAPTATRSTPMLCVTSA